MVLKHRTSWLLGLAVAGAVAVSPLAGAVPVMPAEPVPPAGVEQLRNGSFEDGNADGWNVEYLSGAPTDRRNSNGVGRDNHQDGSYGFNFWDGGKVTQAVVSQTLTDAPRGHYVLSGWADIDPGAGQATMFAGPEDGGCQAVVEVGEGSHSWHRATCEFDWPGGELNAGFKVAMARVSGWMAVDNISLQYFAPPVQGLSLEGVDKTEYRIGQALDPTTVRIVKDLGEGHTEAATPEQLEFTGYNPDTEGEQTVTATLKGTEFSVEFTVNVKVADSERIETLSVFMPEAGADGRIQLTTGVDPIWHIAGISPAGDERLVAPSEMVISGLDINQAGEQTVTFQMKASPFTRLEVPVTVSAAGQDENVPGAEGTFTITSLASADDAGVVTLTDGGVVIDLDAVPAGNATVEIARGAMPDDANFTSVTFMKEARVQSYFDVPTEERAATAAQSSDVRRLVIADWAFAQQLSPTLDKVTFPAQLDELIIGHSAFFQANSANSTALAQVTFPVEVRRLEIGPHAFRQDARRDVPLRDVILPAKAEEIIIGENAFRQKFGRAGGLANVVIPGGLTELNIGELAFSTSPSVRAKTQPLALSARFNGKAAPVATRIAASAFHTGSPNSPVRLVIYTDTAARTSGELFPSLSDDSIARNLPVGAGVGTTYVWNGVQPNEPLRAADSEPVAVIAPDLSGTVAGATFRGWATTPDADEAQYAPGTEIPAEAAAGKLYPVWALAKQTVTYKLNLPERASAPDPVEVEPLKTFEVAAGPDLAAAGLTFVEWNTAADGSGDKYMPGTQRLMRPAGIVLYAQYTYDVVTYNANFDDFDGELPTAIRNDHEGAKFTVGSALTREGYTFTGWNTAAAGDGTSYVAGAEVDVPSRPVVLYAIWEKDEVPAPVEPGDKPGEPGDKPGEPGDKPGEPGDKPGEPGDKPAEPGDKPAEPGEKPAEPGEKPAEPGDKPGEPGDKPAEPGEKPGEKPGETQPEQPAANLAVTAALVDGDKIQVEVTGMLPKTKARVELHSEVYVLGLIEADGEGIAQLLAPIPDGVPAGEHTIVVVAENGTASVKIVLPAVDGPTSPPAPTKTTEPTGTPAPTVTSTPGTTGTASATPTPGTTSAGAALQASAKPAASAVAASAKKNSVLARTGTSATLALLVAMVTMTAGAVLVLARRSERR